MVRHEGRVAAEIGGRRADDTGSAMAEALLSMVVLAVATTFTPGPSTLLAAASGASFGMRRTLPLMAGVAAGLATLMVAAAAGLVVLLQAVPSIHLVVKVLGSAYLLWLCWRIGRLAPGGNDPGMLKSPAACARAGCRIRRRSDFGNAVLACRWRRAWQYVAQRQAMEDRQPDTRRADRAVDNSTVAVTVGERPPGASARELLRPPSCV
jgi:hypothetical protein